MNDFIGIFYSILYIDYFFLVPMPNKIYTPNKNCESIPLINDNDDDDDDQYGS